MKTIGMILREIAALFIDDERLALAILVLVGLCACLAFGLHASPAGVAAALTGGSILVLAFSVRQGTKRRPR
ncbi:hypothetical protein [Bosea sp. TAF32]|uniref:hypothetical protein n=1 Tax=Bosea sp. TAF32 TaxID=3237482 RepID=UPI003F8F0966